MDLSVNYIRKFRPLVYMLLLALTAWLLGRTFWAVFYPPVYELSLPSLQTVEPTSKQKNTYSTLYLFGKSAEPSTPTYVDEKDVKKTRLNLKLLGVLVSPQMSVAIISKSGKSESYAVGEEIQRGVELEEVHPEFVVISNNGLLEKLQMSETENVFADIVSGDSGLLNDKQKAKLDEVKQSALKNPVSIMRYVRFQPVNVSGKIQSVKVWPQQEKEIFEALGFKPGDELLEISGYSVDKLSQSPTLWQELLQKSYLELIVKRDGQNIPLSVQLDN